MNPHNRRKFQGDSKKLRRLMKCADKIIAPYLDKMESPNGQFARVYLSGIAAIVAEGKESRKTFKKAIILAAEMAGVPVNVMSAHGEVTLAMIAGMMQNQDSSPVVGGGYDD